MANNSRCVLKHTKILCHSLFIPWVSNTENSKNLHHVYEEHILGYNASRTNPTSKAKHKFTWILFRFVAISREKPLGLKLLGPFVNLVVTGKCPGKQVSLRIETCFIATSEEKLLTKYLAIWWTL